ncbi:hypothetical protein RRG08_056865 [Elysia crispata]|uniref:Uncharacterized protein n=1 Tax=Elysia crispata TaxID=231223 RepID=A0AAE0ZE84_9GAST|nr:hypothetical protein RRG08_056865 [Elysia crispata]
MSWAQGERQVRDMLFVQLDATIELRLVSTFIGSVVCCRELHKKIYQPLNTGGNRSQRFSSPASRRDTTHRTALISWFVAFLPFQTDLANQFFSHSRNFRGRDWERGNLEKDQDVSATPPELSRGESKNLSRLYGSRSPDFLESLHPEEDNVFIELPTDLRSNMPIRWITCLTDSIYRFRKQNRTLHLFSRYTRVTTEKVCHSGRLRREWKRQKCLQRYTRVTTEKVCHSGRLSREGKRQKCLQRNARVTTEKVCHSGRLSREGTRQKCLQRYTRVTTEKVCHSGRLSREGKRHKCLQRYTRVTTEKVCHSGRLSREGKRQKCLQRYTRVTTDKVCHSGRLSREGKRQKCLQRYTRVTTDKVCHSGRLSREGKRQKCLQRYTRVTTDKVCHSGRLSREGKRQKCLQRYTRVTTEKVCHSGRLSREGKRQKCLQRNARVTTDKRSQQQHHILHKDEPNRRGRHDETEHWGSLQGSLIRSVPLGLTTKVV